MKFDEIVEGDVTSLGAFRQQKHEKQVADVNQQIQKSKDQMFNNIDMSVAAAIDNLVDRGMSMQTAKKIIYGHLSDLVMADDLDDGY